jgi:hypothetical protein
MSRNSFVRRAVRRVGWEQNPLRRGADRLESALEVVLALLLLATPLVTWGVSQSAYRTGARAEQGDRSDRRVQATLLENASDGVQVGSPFLVDVLGRVRWQAPDGSSRTAVVAVPWGALKGADVPVWTDAQGNRVAEPKSHAETVADTVTAGAVAAVTLLALIVVAGVVVRDRLDRHRDRQWESEWSCFEPQWSHPRS